MNDSLKRKIEKTVDSLSDYLVSSCQSLIRIPSVNHPPTGDECACQQYMALELEKMGLFPEVYSLNEVQGLKEHRTFWKGRDYANRPNVTVRRPGTGGGRSLTLSGHIDTVPLGLKPWTRDPFKAEISNGKIYGLGSYDMKGGLAVILTVLKVLQELDHGLRGDLIAESVVDEEFGGVNGTLAGRVRGENCGGMVIVEPTNLAIARGTFGGRLVHITIKGREGISKEGEEAGEAISRIAHLLRWIEIFKDRRQARFKTWNAGKDYPVPLWITKLQAGGWGMDLPVSIPAEAKVELYWQLLPGEEQKEVDNEFFTWLQNMADDTLSNFDEIPEIEFPIRFMPGTEIGEGAPLVQTLKNCADTLLSISPEIMILPAPADMFTVHRDFDIPCVLFGPGGGNAHSADEYVNIEDLIAAAKILTLFAVQWCG